MVASGIRSFQIVFIYIYLFFFNQEMLKCSKNSEGTAELEEALATMLDIIKSVNDSMHQIAITGYEVLFAVAPTLILTHPMFLSSLIVPLPMPAMLCRSLYHILEGCHSVACCGDQKYMSTYRSCGGGGVNVGCDSHNIRNLLKLCNGYAT